MTYMTAIEMHNNARTVADAIIADARTLHGPIVWITGNNYMPPLRAVPAASAVWDADNNDDGELFARFVELLEGYLQEADVLLECPEWDNALYAVDLKRWKFLEHDATGNELGDEWELITDARNVRG